MPKHKDVDGIPLNTLAKISLHATLLLQVVLVILHNAKDLMEQLVHNTHKQLVVHSQLPALVRVSLELMVFVFGRLLLVLMQLHVLQLQHVVK